MFARTTAVYRDVLHATEAAVADALPDRGAAEVDQCVAVGAQCS